jgi:hypothetical protein
MNYCAGPVDNTNNYSKYFTLPVSNTRNTNVTILNDICDLTYHDFTYIKVNTRTRERIAPQVYENVAQQCVTFEDPSGWCYP